MKYLFKTSTVALSILGMASLPATANSLTRASEASGAALSHIVDGSVTILRGSGTVIEGGSQLVVASATAVGDSTVVVLKNVSTGAEIALQASGQGLATLSQLTGRALEAIVTTAGTIIAEGTKVVLFVPAKTAGALFEAAAYTGRKRCAVSPRYTRP